MKLSTVYKYYLIIKKMEKLLENLWFNIIFVSVLFVGTLSKDWIGALLFFGYFVIWSKVIYDKYKGR